MMCVQFRERAYRRVFRPLKPRLLLDNGRVAASFETMQLLQPRAMAINRAEKRRFSGGISPFR